MTRAVRWIVVNLVPGLAISLAVLVVLAVGAEGILRVETPFVEVKWPSHFDPRYGFNFTPNETVMLTNQMDYWTASQANSLGFPRSRAAVPGGPGAR